MTTSPTAAALRFPLRRTAARTQPCHSENFEGFSQLTDICTIDIDHSNLFDSFTRRKHQCNFYIIGKV